MGAVGTLAAADVVAVMAAYRQALRAHQSVINRLNVYPVPDGDTGTNMALTVEAVMSELDGTNAPDDMGAVCHAIAHGSLMGARGNSGVILCQLLRGLTSVFAAAGRPGASDVARALTEASDAARQAVLRPVEGTILTVARVAADGAQRSVSGGGGLVDVLESAQTAAAEGLARTPELLPVLAQAGVVDAGGAGYLLLLDAFLFVVDGRPVPEPPPSETSQPGERGALGPGHDPIDELFGSAREGGAAGGGDELRYEVMYLLEAPDDTLPALKEVWAGLGDSIVVVGGGGLWNCHIHTNDVGGAIEAALDAGRPRDIRVVDLTLQIEEERWVREAAAEAEASTPAPRTAVIAVANGEGIGRIFRSLGVHHLVPGGQSMNPSTAQILEVVAAVGSPEVVLLPNNDNIHAVGMQACELSGELGKTVRMVPTSGIVEGFAALLDYDPEAGADDNARSMAASASRIVAGEVTRAVRDANTMAAGPIRAGQWMGISRDGVEVVGDDLVEVLCDLLGKLLVDGHELVTLIEGDSAGPGETRRVTEWLTDHRPDIAVEVHHGGQPLYPYLVSIE
jgi:DAK2 domain fusion protein YloV